jgi:hemin uptake protein HemP
MTLSLESPKPRKPQAALPVPRVSSAALFGPHKEVVVDHNGREYRLQLTRNGKLILTA